MIAWINTGQARLLQAAGDQTLQKLLRGFCKPDWPPARPALPRPVNSRVLSGADIASCMILTTTLTDFVTGLKSLDDEMSPRITRWPIDKEEGQGIRVQTQLIQ